MHKEPENQPSLFSQSVQAPLPEVQRPLVWDQFVGQEHFLNANFKRLLASDRWSSLIFWGPPGTGKTTLASLIAQQTQRRFEPTSAVTSGVKELRSVFEASQQDILSGKPAWILFVDEIHRLNKAQQDVLLPFLEKGTIRFIGATTENPSFEINNAICSRSLIFRFKELSIEELTKILRRAAKNFTEIDPKVLEQIAHVSLGDARRSLMLFEALTLGADPKAPITLEDFERVKHSQSLYYDKHSDRHYDTISAFIKSVRGSDPDGALYYLARMLEGGEDPLFIARRLIILASEDIGNANPMGLVVATSAFQATHALGMPEARIILAQATTYLCCSEKSNRSYVGIEDALKVVRETGQLEIPFAIRNAATGLMKEWGYGKGYHYAHKGEQGWLPMEFLPAELKDRRFYTPSEIGREKGFSEFLQKRGKPKGDHR